MVHKTTWILVCDASRAHLFREALARHKYALLATFEHPESRARGVDLTSDAQGRKPVGGSMGEGVRGRPGGFHGRPGVEQETNPKEVEAQKFAHELAGVLEKGLAERAYDALVLVAPPHFLGLLKQAVNEQVRKHIEATLPKDLAPLEPREIELVLRVERAA
jgi:protein required for attachment to host cells